MPARTFSIRRRIFALAITLLLVAAVALAVFINDYASRASDRAFDRLLAASALTIADETPVKAKAALIRLLAIRVAALAHPMSDVRKGTTAPVRKSPAPRPAGPLTRKRFEFTVPFEVTSVIRNTEQLSVIDRKGRAWDDLT